MKWPPSLTEFLNEVPATLLQTASGVQLQLWSEAAQASNNIIHLAEKLEPQEVVLFLKDKINGHLIQKTKNHFVEDLEMTTRWLEKPKDYFENFCLLNSTHREVVPFSDKTSKPELKEKMMKFIDGVQGPSLPDAALAIFEELFMNATIDAPREALKHGREIKNPESQFIFERNAKKFVISCRDPYGSLDVQKFLNRMAEVYAKGAGEAMNIHEVGGAGLGCVILFENCIQLIVGCHDQQWSKVSCVIPLACSQRQRAEMKKSLHRIEILGDVCRSSK